MSYFGQVNYRDFPFRERNYGKEVQKYRTIFHRSHPNRLLHHLQVCNSDSLYQYLFSYKNVYLIYRNLTSDKARDVKSHFNVEQWERMETAMLCLMNNANDDFALRKKVLDRLKTDDKEIIAIRQNSNLAERHRKLYNSEARELKYGKALIINQEKYDSTCRPHYEIRHGSHEDEIELAKVRFGILFNAFLETFLQ